MSLQIHRSNALPHLLDALTQVVAAPASPLESAAVMVHSRGLERYLAMQVADRLGICAQLEFVHPAPFLGEVVSAVLGSDADLGAWSTDRLIFAFLDALGRSDVMEHPAVAPVRDYLDQAVDGRKAMALAAQVAALFERYAQYRSELVARWTDGADDGWEAVLWRAMSERLPGADAGRLVERFERTLAELPVPPPSIPRRVLAFSVATLPPLSVRLLAAIAEHAEVHVFVYMPSRALWERLAAQSERIRSAPGMPVPADLDLAVEHPLLASCGATARDFQVGLLRYAPGAVHHDLSVPPEASTALATLQADLFEDRVADAVLLPDCDSIEVHACHGPTRQAQVLREVLLRLLDQVEDLEPRDIIVMTPDIEAWAPRVHAALGDGAEDWSERGSHPSGLPRLPYRVADRGVRYENPAAEALLAVLGRASSRLTATQVMDLLAHEPIREHFDIAVEDLPELRRWVLGSGVRWGLDAAHREGVGQPPTDAYTWREGLDRLLLGQAVGEPTLVLDAVPWGEVEGRDTRTLLGCFVDFCECLFEELSDLDQPRTLMAWRARLVQLFERMIGSTDGASWRREQILAGLDALVQDAAISRCVQPLDLPALYVLLEGRFGTQQPGQGFLSGGITVCQLVPMRAIPFRVVVLLGMDEGSFPRGGRLLAFDRMRERRLGDRSSREDDRALFLEALLAARERLVVLYSGRDPLRNREQPPAIPVGELLDAIDARFITDDGRPARAHLTTEHPLQAFALRRFADEALRPYDRRLSTAAAALLQGMRAPASAPPFLTQPLPELAGESVVSLEDLIRFWMAPARRLFQVRLGLFSQNAEDPLIDREPLELDALQRWALRDHLLKARLAGEDIARPGPVWACIHREARLPLGEPGRQVYDAVVAEALRIADVAEPLRVDPQPAVEVDLELGGWRLTGQVQQRFGGQRVAVRAGAVRAKHALAVWIGHLAWQAVGGSGRSVVLGRSGSRSFSPVEVARAEQILTDLLVLYGIGMRYPLLFFPASSRAWAAEVTRAGRSGSGDSLAWTAFGKPSGWRDSECDAFMRRLGVINLPFFQDKCDLSGVPMAEGCGPRELAERVWLPALSHEEWLP